MRDPVRVEAALTRRRIALNPRDRPAMVAVVDAPPRSTEPPADVTEKAIAYSRARYRLYFADTAYGLGLLAAVILLRIGPALRDAALHVADSPTLQTIAYATLLFALLAVGGLPTDIASHRLALRFEQSVQGWGSWARDWLKSSLLSIAIGTVLATVLYAVVRTSPERWWLVFWLASLPILVFLLFLQPLVIAPLFFEFRPLAEAAPTLVPGIERIVTRAGVAIPPQRMFVMNASAKLTSVNAYVAGFGASKRVVVWDTTLAKMTNEETLFIFGHELGHYVLRHVAKAITVASAALLVALWASQHLVEWVIARHGDALGIHDVSDPASLPLLLLVLSLGGFFARPLFGAYSRRNEHAADVYGLTITETILERPGATAARAFRRLAEIALADPAPPPFIRFWLYTHPPIGERIAFAETFGTRR
jgi:Zn-dependent protease with chaperone function